jgi:hypothetical protein
LHHDVVSAALTANSFYTLCAQLQADVVVISSDIEEETKEEEEAGPRQWTDPTTSYLFIDDTRLSADQLHAAESIIVPRAASDSSSRVGARVRSALKLRLPLEPWAGWKEGKVYPSPMKGTYCTSGGAQCLWDGEWLNDEV